MKLKRTIFGISLLIMIAASSTNIFSDYEGIPLRNEEVLLRKESYQMLEQQEFLTSYQLHTYDNLFRVRRIDTFNEVDARVESKLLYYHGDNIADTRDEDYYQDDWVIKEEIYDQNGIIVFEKSYTYYNNAGKYIRKGRCYDYVNDYEYFYKYYYDTSLDIHRNHQIQEIAYYDGDGVKFASEYRFYDTSDRLWITAYYGSISQSELNHIHIEDMDERLNFGMNRYDYYHPERAPLAIKKFDVIYYDSYNRKNFIATYNDEEYVYKIKKYIYDAYSRVSELQHYQGYTQFLDGHLGFENEFVATDIERFYMGIASTMEFVFETPNSDESASEEVPEDTVEDDETTVIDDSSEEVEFEAHTVELSGGNTEPANTNTAPENENIDEATDETTIEETTIEETSDEAIDEIR